MTDRPADGSGGEGTAEVRADEERLAAWVGEDDAPPVPERVLPPAPGGPGAQDDGMTPVFREPGETPPRP